MDADGIGLVLARASELRSKITNCIHRASAAENPNKLRETEEGEDKANGYLSEADKASEEAGVEGEEDGEEEEEETLLSIRDALESLEAQLSSLQALQQQQWYEKEAALGEIDYSRKKLLKELKEYKGKDLEVIHEAAAFASETVEDSNDLLLPPYPSRPSRSLISDNGYLSHIPSTNKLSQNGFTGGDMKMSLHEIEKIKVQSTSQNSPKGLRFFVNTAAKSLLTLVGVITILSLAGFEPKLKKRDSKFKVFSFWQQRAHVEEGNKVQCPPGRVLVVENGEERCLVKERVEIPFQSVVGTPDVNYGCG